jgi:hypothetical protein
MRSFESQPPAPEEEPPGRWPPDWARIVLLVAFTGAILLGLNWLMHDAPPPARPVPTATIETAPVPVAQPTVAVARPTVAPTAVPTRPPTPAPTAQPTVTAAPTMAPAVSPDLAATLATDWWDWSMDQIEPAQKAEAVTAVDRYESTLATSWWQLDPERLSDAVTEPRLDELSSIIRQRQQQGRALKADLQRTGLLVRYIDGSQAVVYESYIDRSVAVDLATRVPLEAPTPVPRESSYLLWKIDGTYKVAQVVSHEDQPNSP